MMMNTRKKRLAIAVAGVISLGASTAQATDFSATATLQNTLTVTNVLDFDVGSVFATVTGAALANGVGALVIAPDGTVTDPTDSATVNLISLSTPVPAQASVDITSDFVLTLPDTTAIKVADFPDDVATSSLATITGGTANATELIHSSANPTVPSLFLIHWTIGDVSGGVSTEVASTGVFNVVQGFGETTYVFNIGATVTTEPTVSEESYQEGVYSGTFAVTASY
jgi:hypothetical protein